MTSIQENIIFKKLDQNNIPLLVEWFAQPHVSEWWPILEKNKVVEHFLKRIHSKDTYLDILYTLIVYQ